ncbi:MAG: 4Fe-4S dicluster domain-containing protein [Desulfobacterales bacterium]|nr:4Fe-4S dicluster domain-containing protein [Desulfobacterales bacterium]MBS3756254.1 4Fe-4S dicluster domain-containing protein [Desulfobacterales bacterium]
MDRRTFLKLAGMGSLTFASACTLESEKKLYSLVKNQDDMVSGKANWYAATCRRCPAGCGVLAKNREGRVIKLEGNPLHPVNRGKLCIRGQSGLQAVYHPDRLKRPRIKQDGRWQALSFEEAIARLAEKTRSAAARGKNRVRMLTCLEGDVCMGLFEKSMAALNGTGPLVFEPFSHEHLRSANQAVFGVSGLPSYRLENADCLVSLGADFLETWLSPLEYARRFKAMHAYADGKKGLFFHVSPWRGLTGANADAWLSCRPGAEAVICLGLIRQVLARKGPSGISAQAARQIRAVSEPYTREKVIELSGIDQSGYDQMADALLLAKDPLILGAGALGRGRGDLQANIAANLLNFVLDPQLGKIDFTRRHRAEKAAGHGEIAAFFDQLTGNPPDVLLLNNVNPVYALPPEMETSGILANQQMFTVCFSNFMDETAQCADMVFPVSMALESWDEYGAYPDLLSFCQPAMKPLYGAPQIGDVFLRIAPDGAVENKDAKQELISRVQERWGISDTGAWLQAVRAGGRFDHKDASAGASGPAVMPAFQSWFEDPPALIRSESLLFAALPSVRFFDGRDAHIPWLCEIPDPVTKVAWQSPVLMHPETARKYGVRTGDVINLMNRSGSVSAPVYETQNIRPGLAGLQAGQGHAGPGRYSGGRGANPFSLFSLQRTADTETAFYAADTLRLEKSGSRQKLASTAGSMDPHGRKIALTVALSDLTRPPGPEKQGLAMHDFPLTLPMPEGYDAHRDFYPPHGHADYRWAMAVDLDRCIGCSACAAACYAENNLAVVGKQEVINGREMSWMHIEHYQQMDRPDQPIFLPMLCQHCDNAPCESVCPVFAPHHNKEGLNNQIYNRCIGTRFCAQNCPYKVRRFNWHDWNWPQPLNLQLNPDVTVRSKGVMEKCSFCVQRIKAAHGNAKDENRMIRDGEVSPACVQTCPTGALVFGSLMDPNSRVSKLVSDRRAYQVMGYLNTKPAVIYLKKVVHEI